MTTLITDNPNIGECLCVMHHNDLDRLTREDGSSRNKTSSKGEAPWVSAGSGNQFSKFQEGCIKENTNTAAIVLR
jgi:type I restriction enzyme R subunit